MQHAPRAAKRRAMKQPLASSIIGTKVGTRTPESQTHYRCLQHGETRSQNACIVKTCAHIRRNIQLSPRCKWRALLNMHLQDKRRTLSMHKWSKRCATTSSCKLDQTYAAVPCLEKQSHDEHCCMLAFSSIGTCLGHLTVAVDICVGHVTVAMVAWHGRLTSATPLAMTA